MNEGTVITLKCHVINRHGLELWTRPRKFAGQKLITFLNDKRFFLTKKRFHAHSVDYLLQRTPVKPKEDCFTG